MVADEPPNPLERCEMAELVGHPGEHPAGEARAKRKPLFMLLFLDQFVLVEICVPPVADTHVLLPTHSGRGALAAWG